MLTASNWNVCQYAVLVHMMARASGLEAGELGAKALQVPGDAEEQVPLPPDAPGGADCCNGVHTATSILSSKGHGS